ncbi:hypothetical protein C0Q70_02713 [Pomacea canaliculata]|uniref:Uncharacterized protein n=1 Tax=Pomacea canaliculata TaxID=400727 RepID=A0A2T7PQT5_POMCA|nr:hypothetical protein C0Q70_02713 [Pomacea canaliculata]
MFAAMAAAGSSQGTSSCTLREAVLQGGLPMLIRLEEGFYGPDEATCMSLGDVLALQSAMVVNSQNVVIAYYKNDTSIKDETDDIEEVETYRALLILSLDNEDIASLRITRFPDPGGLAFSRYVTGIFSDCDWFGREKELMISMAPLKKDKASPGPASSGMPFGPNMFNPPVSPQSREPSQVTSGKTLKRTCGKLVTVAATVTRRRKVPAESSVSDTATSPSSPSRPTVFPQLQTILRTAKNKTTSSSKSLFSRLSSIVSQDARRKCDDHSSTDADSDYAELDEALMDAHTHFYQRLSFNDDNLKLPPPTSENNRNTGRADVRSVFEAPSHYSQLRGNPRDITLPGQSSSDSPRPNTFNKTEYG